MKGQSEFQKILEEAVRKTNPAKPSASQSRSGSQTIRTDFHFGHDFFKVKFFRHPKVYSGAPKSTVESPKVKVQAKKIEPRAKIRLEKPIPRVKRKLTFDQIKALRIFHYFGEAGLDECYTADEMKSAYHRLAKKYHPDGCGKKSGEEFKLISSAYRKLAG